MKILCPNCSRGFGWPHLDKTGCDSPEYKCIPCGMFFNSDLSIADKPVTKIVEETPNAWTYDEEEETWGF